MATWRPLQPSKGGLTSRCQTLVPGPCLVILHGRRLVACAVVRGLLFRHPTNRLATFNLEAAAKGAFMARVVVIFAVLVALASQAVTAADRPNIVYILADDLGWTD